MNIPLELADVLNWREANPVEKKQEISGPSADATVDYFLSTMHPVYDHMFQFGIDYHKFMDNNDPAGLLEFIEKYKNDKYWRLAKFANGLQLDIDAVTNTLLYPNISNGLVEGINSLIKSIKRVGGGKAKIDLLTAKMVIRHLTKPAKAIEDTA